LFAVCFTYMLRIIVRLSSSTNHKAMPSICPPAFAQHASQRKDVFRRLPTFACSYFRPLFRLQWSPRQFREGVPTCSFRCLPSACSSIPSLSCLPACLRLPSACLIACLTSCACRRHPLCATLLGDLPASVDTSASAIFRHRRRFLPSPNVCFTVAFHDFIQACRVFARRPCFCFHCRLPIH